MRFKSILILFTAISLLFSDDINITGNVVNTQDSSVAGVLVTLLRNGDSAITDDTGNFTIIGIVPIISNSSLGAKFTHATYSHSTGILSFSVVKNKQPVVIDIFTLDGKKVGTVLNDILKKGAYQIKPFEEIKHHLSVSVYLIRLQCGNSVSVFKDIDIDNRPGASFQYNLYAKSITNERVFAEDTLQFSKKGYQTLKIPLENYISDVGTVIMSRCPICEITAPADNAVFNFGDTLAIAADASDSAGYIAAVSFYIDNELFVIDSTRPYSCTWNTLRNTIGNRSIKAVAEDANGVTATDAITIAVNSDSVITYTYEIVNRYVHDSTAYTQGLVYENGFFFEGTGISGLSTLRKVEIETGKVLQSISLDEEYFGEGIVIWENRIIQLTWHGHVAFIWDKETFTRLDSVVNPHDGWGITHDGSRLILSDGSSYLFFWDPVTFQQLDSVRVKDKDSFVPKLNELEYFYHKVFANVYSNDFIVIIDVASGTVLGRIDCANLINSSVSKRAGVLNGIAYDPDHDRIYLTGKNWPKMFEVKLVLK